MKMILIPLLFTLSIVFSNDAPNWLEIPPQSIEEDNRFQIDLEPFVEDPDGDLINLLDPILISGEIEGFAIDSFILTVDPEQEFYGVITLQLTADDGELTSSTELVLNVEAINDLPLFESIGDIEINEDEAYNNTWAFDIYDVETDLNDLFFTVTFDNPDLIESYSLDSEGYFSINPNLHANGETGFQVYLTDDEGGESGIYTHSLTINSVNDPPSFDNIGDIEINEDESYSETWATNISTGAYNEDQDLFFTVTFDNPDLIESYALTPNGQLTIVPTLNMFGDTSFSVQLFDSAFDSSDIYTYSLTINSVNDVPEIVDQSFIIYDEDCGGDSCDDINKLILDITMFDVEDVEDSDELLTFFIDHDNINDDNYTTDDNLGILIDQDYYGLITVPVYIIDSENAQSETFNCEIEISPINDIPSFDNIGDIEINEDESYDETWATNISTGAYNEDQDLFFTVTFDNPDLIESYALTPNGQFTINPTLNVFGVTLFQVYLTDEQGGETQIIENILTINSVNDLPEIVDQSFIIYDEDCGGDSCDDINKLILDITMFDVEDVEDSDELLTFFIDHENINNHYTTDGDLGILIAEDYNSENEGVITVPVYITDSENGRSENFDCDIVINAINDNPEFSNSGDITINEDNLYYTNWASDISTGAYNEDQDLFFTVTFDNSDLIESYSLDSEGYFSINPNLHANGATLFQVYLTDEQGGESQIIEHILTINPVNDPPSFEFSPSSYNVDEDSGEYLINWAFNIKPGGGDGVYKEEDQIDSLIFVIENTYDQTLFNILPNIVINEENEGVLSFSLDENMNGATELSITLQDGGDNQLDDNDDSNDGFNISDNVTFPIQVNQINDIPVEFSLFSDLRNYQIDQTTFYTSDNDNIYFRYPYQSVYIDNQLPNKLRFEWEWIDSLDIDIYSDINKDIRMEHIYYRLEAVEATDLNNVIILADSLIYNVSNSVRDYEVDIDNNIVRIDIDLNTINGLDLSGNTSYNWRVIAQNYQLDYQDSDPEFYSEDQNYSFYIDITLPTVNMVPLYDDIFSENFDLYMLSTERLIDFDGNNRPIKLWVDYGINGSDDEILFPDEVDTLNYIYYLSHSFLNSGDIRLKYQMRDRVQNINAGLEDISFGIIDPIYNSTINFFNELVVLDIPKNSIDNQINCLIKSGAVDEIYNNLDIIGDVIEIYPKDVYLSKESSLSFDLNRLNSLYNPSNLAIYKLDNNWEKCDTYIENNFLKTKINQFGHYAIFYSENHQTEEMLPVDYILHQNYPNPFNPHTTIKYYIPQSNNIDLVIYNIKGEKVKTLYSGYIDSGYHSIIWDGKFDSGIESPSGIYIVSFNYNNDVITSKVVKIK